MVQKCNGVKILDLEDKDVFTGGEYAVIAEKDANYKVPLEQIGDAIINSSKFKAKVDRAYEASIPTATVALENNEFTFTFGIPAGSKGDNGYNGKDGRDGKDGKDGIDGVPGIDGDTIRAVIAYKSTNSSLRPDTPTGGSWDAVTGVVTYPEGWSGSDANPYGYVWMSSAAFSSKGTQVQAWSTPIRLTGEDGRDGVDGKNIEFIYKLTVTDLTKPQKPGNIPNKTDYVPEGWTDHPSGITEQYQCEWMCSRTLAESGLWNDWQGPNIWSRWGTSGKDGDGREYIFQRTKLPAPPHDITDNNPDQDEYIPQPYPGEQSWTDDPRGVDSTYQWEWVSQRKYDGDTHKWSNFSSPALWAKYGDTGQDGMSIRVMYTRTSSSEVKPAEPNRLNINPGSVWSVGMPTATGKQAIWGIQALVTYDNQLYIDTSLPEEERGWQGPYLITGVPGLDGNNFNYQVDAYKLSSTQPVAPTSTDPYNPGNGWVLNPDVSTGTWWKCTALVQGETATVISWGAVVKVTGSSINILGTLGSVDELPTTGNQIGDGYIIDGYLWTWNGTTWVNVGKIEGPNGNYVEYRFARNNSWSTAPSISKTIRYPSGWSTGSPALSDGSVLWATFATISGADNTLLTDWADPYYMTGMTGDQGGSGIPGVGYEVRYCKGTETTYTGEQWSDTMKRKRNPEGWSIDVPELVSGDEYNYIWFIQCRIINDELEAGQYWSKPNPMGGIIAPDPVSGNPIIYPAGVFSKNTTYINDGETAPYVWDTNDGGYYFLEQVTGPSGWISSNHNNVTPATDGGASWTKFENYEALYAAIGVFGNALVGGAVFNSNLMFSQRGKNASGADVSNYEDINITGIGTSNPDTSHVMDTTNSFRPNFLLDFTNGEAYFGAGDIHLTAEQGESSFVLNTEGQKISLNRNGLSIKDTTVQSGDFTRGTFLTLQGITQLADTHNFVCDNTGLSFFAKDGSSGDNGQYMLQINPNGSGLIGNGITWDSNGNVVVNNTFEQNVSQLNSAGTYGYLNLPDIPEGYGKTILFVTPLYSRGYMGHSITMATANDRLTHREMPETYRGTAPIVETIEGTNGTVTLSSLSAYICYGVKNTGSSYNIWVLNQLMNYTSPA